MFDFEIEISPGEGDSYRVSARSAAGDTDEVVVRFPFDDVALGRQLQAVEFALLRSSASTRRLTSEQERPVQDFGRQLFEFMFPPDIRAHLAVSRSQAVREDTAIRLRLRTAPPELAVLPWEFLYDPARDDYLCLSTPLVRYLDVPETRRPLQVEPPLRILAMAARPDELDSLNIDHEQRQLQQALATLEDSGRVQLSWVQGQTWWDLQAALDQGRWHGFHFIGHGGFDSQAGEGILALAGEDGGVDRLPASDLAAILAEHRSLRLVVLNSCDSARATATDRFSSTASMLMRRGVPAVVAMQYEISDQAAIAFARGFYTAIAAQHPVDQAVTRARRAVKRARKNTLEWATPVLYLRSATGDIFNLTDIPTTPEPSEEIRHTPTTSPAEPAPAHTWAAPPPDPEVDIELGDRLKQHGDVAGARAAYQRAIDSQHADQAPRAARNLGLLLAEQGDAAGAKTAYQHAIDSQHADQAPRAASNLGNLLAEQGDVAGAKTTYQRAIDSGHADWAPMAARNLGLLLAEQGDAAGAKTAYQHAIDSGHPDEAPRAANNLGVLLAEQGDAAGAKTAYQHAIDSQHADQAPRAANNLGVLLAEQGDVAGAKTTYQHAIDSGHADWAPMAANNLGLLLAEQGDAAGAKTAYQHAIDSGHADWAPRAANNLGLLLAEQGDVTGARAAYQHAIDSGHADWAPMAANNLGLLLAKQGDVTGARAAYQHAIDSGHADQSFMAENNLRRLLLRDSHG